MNITKSITNRSRFTTSIICLLLILGTFGIFYRVVSYDFVNFDDDLYVTANFRVQKGLTLDNFTWAFRSIEVANWHPLTWLSHMADIQIHELNPGGHHLTNLILHVANTLLVFIIFSKMTGLLRQSACLAALFALHPLHVESVAWVAERKDVISTFFLFLTLWCYRRYAEHPDRARYSAVLLFFLMGLLCKPMVVTLPFILLLLDFWPLKRLRRDAVWSAPQWHAKVDARTHGISNSNQSDKLSTTTPGLPSRSILYLIREKIPFLLLSAISCGITIVAQHNSGTVSSLEVIPFAARIANAIISYVAYIGQMILPSRLAVFYPYPSNNQGWMIAAAAGILILISYLAWKAARKYPYFLFGWLWYIGTLFPVSGIVQVGAQARADRYTYIPLIGLFILIIWGVSDLAKKWSSWRTVISSGAIAILVVLAAMTWIQIGYWKNSVTLFSHAIDVTSDNYLAHNNLGNALAALEKKDEAMAHYSAALRIHPNYAEAHYNMGRMLTDKSQFDAAIRHYSEALELDPKLKLAHYNLGLLMAQSGKDAEAIRHFSNALRLDIEYAEAHNNLGVMRMRQGRIKEAVSHFKMAVHLMPGYETANRNLAKSLKEDQLN